MDIQQLKYFISAAAIGNFTLAALENNISQSSFSKQIMNLEHELGTELFIRQKRTVELTPAGEQFQVYAQRMLNTYEEMLRGMESFSAFQTLPVSIASIPVFQSYALATIIFSLKQRYPDILFSLEEKAESTEVRHLLHSGRCDFAIMRTDFLEQETYNIYPIVRDRLVAVVPDTHPLADSTQISLRQLRDDQFIMPPEKTDLRIISQNACIAHGFRPKPAYISSGNINLVLDLIEVSGTTYLAFEKVIRHHAKDRTKCRIIPLEECIESDTAFVSLKARGVTKAQAKVERFLEEVYRPAPRLDAEM